MRPVSFMYGVLDDPEELLPGGEHNSIRQKERNDTMKVKNFTYNGLFGRPSKGYAKYTAEFKEWTEDPGIAICTCSDGEDRRIPTFALEGFDIDLYPQQYTDNKFMYMGIPCKS